MSKINIRNYIKTVQRRANSLVKKQNKAIEEDELWLGRFYITQLRRDVYRYEDGSGALINFIFEFADKKTGKRDICRLNSYELNIQDRKSGGSWKLFCALNNFIVKTVNVWAEEPTPSLKNAENFQNKPRLGQMKLSQLRYFLY